MVLFFIHQKMGFPVLAVRLSGIALVKDTAHCAGGPRSCTHVPMPPKERGHLHG